MNHKGNKFESKVHLGLLVIIFVLVFLNFISNLIIYRSRSARREILISSMQSATVAIRQVLPSAAKPSLSAYDKAKSLRAYRLNSIHIFNAQSKDQIPDNQHNWLGTESHQLPPKIINLAERLLKSGFQTLERGSGDEYFFISPIVGTQRSLLILSRKDPELAYLDDGHRTIVVIGIVVNIVLVIFYLLLSRTIFVPFRKLKQEARQAGRPIDDNNDDVHALIEEYRNVISELKEKEQQLLRLNEGIRLKADSLEQFNKYLLQSIRSGIVTIDLDGNVMMVNRAAADILDVAIDDCPGKTYRTLLSEDSTLANILAQSLDCLQGTEYKEIDVTTHDERYLTLGVSTSIINGGNGQPLGVSMLLNDLSEITQLRSELETKERLAVLGEMTGGLAHQLRNSMGAISGYLTLLKRRMGKRNIHEESIPALFAEVSEAQDLVERFLQFARPLQIYKTPELVNNLVSDVIKSFEAREDCVSVRFSIITDCQLTADIDALLLKQALTNIIENAVLSYDSAEGEVTIEIAHSDQDMTISVADKGSGISAENLGRIFTPFFSSRAGGTGLGLPLARKIVNLHGGRLSVSSKPDVGTVFLITLPLIHLENNLKQQPISHIQTIS